MSLHLSSAPWSEQRCILSPGLLGTSLEPPDMQGIEGRPRGPGVYVGGVPCFATLLQELQPLPGAQDTAPGHPGPVSYKLLWDGSVPAPL